MKILILKEKLVPFCLFLFLAAESIIILIISEYFDIAKLNSRQANHRSVIIITLVLKNIIILIFFYIFL